MQDRRTSAGLVHKHKVSCHLADSLQRHTRDRLHCWRQCSLVHHLVVVTRPRAIAALPPPLPVLQEFVTQASGQLVGLYAELIGAVLPNISHPNKDIQAVAKEANAALLNLQPSAELPVKVEVAPVLAIISRELRSEQEPTHLEALRW